MTSIIVSFIFGLISGTIVTIIGSYFGYKLREKRDKDAVRSTFHKVLKLFVGNYEWYIEELKNPTNKDKETLLSRWNDSVGFIMNLLLNRHLTNYLSDKERKKFDSFFIWGYALKSTVLNKTPTSILNILKSKKNLSSLLDNCKELEKMLDD